jgi:hypothetical protein
MIKYKLFKDGKGVVADRMPKRFKANVTLSFGEGVTGYTLILKDANGNYSYRELNGGKATVPIDFLNGEISVSLANLNSSEPRYQCEGLICKKEEGITWIMPEGLNLPLEISECKRAVEDLRKEFKELRELVLRLKAEYEDYELI